MIENGARAKATQSTVDDWIKRYKCAYDVVADPGFSMAPPTGGSIGLPYNVIIDPRTMQVVKVIQGAGPGVDAALNSLATKNKI